MKAINLSQIANLLNLKSAKNLNCLFKRVSNNINNIGDDTLVFHLNKDVELDIEKFNILKNCYIISDQPVLNNQQIDKSKFLYVLNINDSYRAFINYYRDLFDVLVVAVTGTCGKTTTKEMIAQVLRNKYKVVSTIRSKNALRHNFNYLMRFDDSTNFGVFETAITSPGHLISGCEYFKPYIGIITTIGIDHLNGCKTLNNYIRTKGEILAGLQNQGILIINNDDVNIRKINLDNYQGTVISFGIKNHSDFYGSNVKYFHNGMQFVLHHNGEVYKVFVPGLGEHNVYNALGAIAALKMLGMDISESIGYLSKFKHIQSHLEVKKGINNSIVIDDTWSSNPTSVKAALKVLSQRGKEKTKIAVLGKISYLGKFESHYYKEIGKMLVDYKIDYLLTKDQDAKEIGIVASKLGMNKNKIFDCNSNEELQSRLKSLLNSNTIVLFKVSMLDKSYKSILNDTIDI